jgi:hypothetical protein
MAMNNQNQTITSQFDKTSGMFYGLGLVVALATSWLLHIQVVASSSVAPLHQYPTHPQPHPFPYLFLTLSLVGTTEFH